jgi:hypothetical protein
MFPIIFNSYVCEVALGIFPRYGVNPGYGIDMQDGFQVGFGRDNCRFRNS